LISRRDVPLFRVERAGVAYSVRLRRGEASLCREESEAIEVIATFKTLEDAIALVEFVRQLAHTSGGARADEREFKGV